MAKKENPTPWERPDCWYDAQSAEGQRIKENPRSIMPSLAGWGQEPSGRDTLISALMGFGKSMQNVQQAAALGDPFTAALAGIAGAGQQPGPQAVAQQRYLQMLESAPVESVSPALVERFPELQGLPLSVVQKIGPMLQRSDLMEQQLALSLARMNADATARKDTAQARKDQAAALKRLPPNQVLALNEGKNVARLLPEVEDALNQNAGIFGPIEGKTRGSNPYDTGAQTVDARMRTAAQAFGRFMEGGVLRKEDEEKYRKMFPQLSDTPELARNKLAIVQRQLIQKYEDDRATLGRSGYDVSGFEALATPASVFDKQASSGEVLMVSPSGKTGMVPAAKVAAAEAAGYRRAQ